MATDNGNDQVIDTSPSPGPPGSSPTAGVSFDANATFDPSALPSFVTPTDARNWAADGYLNVLLVGVDAGLGGSRNTGLRPDTMIVLHVDIKTGQAAMIGVPRNTMCVPLPSEIAKNYATPANGCPADTWPYMLNWLANEAGWNHPANFPFYQGAGLEYTRAMTATEQAIGTLMGLTIDGYVVINLDGLVSLINALGGIDINVPTAVSDYPCGPAGSWAAKWRVCDICGSTCAMASRIHDGYELPDDNGAVIPQMIADAAASGGKQSITWQMSGGSNIAFVIKPGPQHMDGEWALAYARTRIYTTDYDRMLRQQLVLKAIRNTIDPCTILPKVPSLLNSLGSAFWTNLPLADATQWAGLAKGITGGNVKSITLDPATLGVNTTYINPTTWARAKSIVAHSLDTVPAASSSGGGGGGLGC
jgi:anionic cell wall polymer biosynthesis LytR-Cps2A-Psr (LCP) family protein